MVSIDLLAYIGGVQGFIFSHIDQASIRSPPATGITHCCSLYVCLFSFLALSLTLSLYLPACPFFEARARRETSHAQGTELASAAFCPGLLLLLPTPMHHHHKHCYFVQERKKEKNQTTRRVSKGGDLAGHDLMDYDTGKEKETRVKKGRAVPAADRKEGAPRGRQVMLTRGSGAACLCLHAVDDREKGVALFIASFDALLMRRTTINPKVHTCRVRSSTLIIT